ncbi:amidohydrolase [Flagellimonas zhangzhouensis]|uniref:Omega-amidase YafV n=1 Tax=Flagellimonas zhangzhouensis TaxID=1073328 RepID=A0A1H2V7J4_9FLAO|nr:amidohydrolase [Allomuricauda zhangzhouensis]SDQ10034.1 Predicted amidohydrolase [Allomuricauda zhangzhouensis]SDW64318.1 Carbon-nitrogen hydrolase [Allomuricauda zhangzhouensis]
MSLTLKIALIQSPMHWENPQKNRGMFEEKINAISKDVDLIILPEMFTTGFTMTPQNLDSSEGQKTVQWMQDLAIQKDTALVGSVVIQEGELYYNRLFFVYPDGTFKTYDKKHTFTLAGEDKVYKAGTERLTLEYKGFRICPLICYDLRFPVWARNTSDYDVLIYVANWPIRRINAWDTLLKARAIENMSYAVGVNCLGKDGLGYEYPGHSAVYDVLGEPLTYSEKEEVLYATLEKEHITTIREKLKFLEDRDDFNLKG